MNNQLKIENTLEVIQNFLSPHTEGAILINGSWGSGKTHFWENEIKPIVRTKNFKPAYISLNGITNISDLEHITLVTIIETLNKQEKKFFKNSIGIIMNLISKTSSIFLRNSLSDIVKTVGINKIPLSNFVICVDDLERSNLKITQILGFFNNLMEHQKAKIIILADESKIVEFNEYQLHKEKLVKWSLKFERNYDDLVKILLDKVKNYKLESYEFLIKHKKWLKSSIKTLEVKNIRTLYFSLELFHKIKPIIDQLDEKYQLEILWFVLTISQEYKGGKLIDSNNYQELDIIGNTFNFHLANRKPDEENSFAFIFFKKYFHDAEREYFFYKTIFNFVLTGYLDVNSLKNEILSRVPDPDKPEEVAKEELLTYYFRKIEDDQFAILAEKVWEYAKNGNYVIYDYVRIAHFYYFFSQNKLIDKSMEEVDSMIEEGLHKSSIISQYNDESLENLLIFPSEAERENNLKLKVRSIHKSLKEKFQKYEFNSLLKNFNTESSIDLFFNNYKFQKELFTLIDAKSFFSAISECKTSSLQVIREKIKDRYASNNIKEFYPEDSKFIIELIKMLNNAVLNEHFKGRLKIFLINEITNELKIALEKLR